MPMIRTLQLPPSKYISMPMIRTLQLPPSKHISMPMIRNVSITTEQTHQCAHDSYTSITTE